MARVSLRGAGVSSARRPNGAGDGSAGQGTQLGVRRLHLWTHWLAVEIDGQRVSARAAVEAHLVLSADGRVVRGSTGCNRLAGRFEQGVDELRFKGLATTKMACASPAGAMEAPFLAALGAITSQRIVGETLELRDARGTVRMRLEARPPR